MAEPSEISNAILESRVRALEVEVTRLSEIVDSEYAVGKIAMPLALALLNERAQHMFSAKFFALIDAGESLLMYSAALAFAAAYYKGGQSRDELLNAFAQPPSLGRWNAELQKCLDAHILDWPMDILRTVFRRNREKPTSTARYLQEEFIALRNRERGHASRIAEGHYEALYQRNILNIQDCIRNSHQLEIPLVHIEAVDIIGEKQAYTATRLMGGAPTTYSEPIVLSARVSKGATCVWNRADQQLLQLEPFLSYRFCKECGQNHVFFAERITKEKIFFHSYVGNHRLVFERDIQ